MDVYREELWRALQNVAAPDMIDIPPSKAQMMAKAAQNTFDGGRTVSWMEGQEKEWCAVRDIHTGHAVHVLSNRNRAALLPELAKGLRLMAWISKRPLTWYWWDNPWVRVLPAGADPGPEHINGGWAIPGVPEVHVYRREDAHKVLLHESIHALLLDVRPSLVETALDEFETALGRRLWPHLGECYTELFAAFLWSIVQPSLGAARKAWSAQLKCSETQAAQIWRRIRYSRQNEETNVFAYYVLKWVLMQHEEVLLGPNHSVSHWFRWFQELRPRLDAMASLESDESVKMSMTCGQ